MKNKKGIGLITLVIIIVVVLIVMTGIVWVLQRNNDENTKNEINSTKNKIELNENTDNNVNGNSNSINEHFKYYFAFKDIDIKKFDKSKALKNIYDYHGGEVTTLPIKYENLNNKFKSYYLKKGRYIDEILETSTIIDSEIRWGKNSDELYLTINFYESSNKSIAEAMANHNFYKSLGNYYYDLQLGITKNNDKEDIDVIIEKLGNPNEIYINSEIYDYTAKEKADYWLVYNYNDYILAFNFTESSNKDRAKDNPVYIAPHLKDAYYIDGNSFKKGINAIKSTIFEDYYTSQFDIIIK